MGSGASTSAVRRPWEYPNQLPIAIIQNIGAGASFNLVPAASPQKLYIFGLYLNIDNSANTGPTDVTLDEVNGATVHQLVGMRDTTGNDHDVPFYGAPVEAGFGLQLTNHNTALIGAYGTLIYSKDI